MKREGQFKLEFPCLEVFWSGVKQRGLIIGFSEMGGPGSSPPGLNPMCMAIVVLEKEAGKIVQMPVPRLDIEVAQKNAITLVEAQDVRGVPVGDRLIVAP